jgi:hypothetical protein
MDEKGVTLATSLYRYLTASGRRLQRQARRGAQYLAIARTGAEGVCNAWFGRNGTGRPDISFRILLD